MATDLKTIIYPVRDLERAKKIYGRLLGGVSPAVDTPHYVQFTLGDLEVGLDPNGHAKGMTGPIGYWHVLDIEESVTRLVDAGGKVQQAVTSLGGRLLATVDDGEGNVIGLVQNT